MKLSANEAAIVSGLNWAVMGIVTAVVVYGDVMFIQLMWNHFPDGLLRVGALGGAITTALSIIVLLIGKSHWFRPGGQLLAAYFFTAVEVGVSVLNVLYASGVQDGVMAYWKDLSPATPFVALVGWVVILQLDRATQEKHEAMEMEDEIAASERAFRLQNHRASMRVRVQALQYNESYMLDALESPQHQESIRIGAEKLTRSAIQQLTGQHVPTSPRIIDSLPPQVQVSPRPIIQRAALANTQAPAPTPVQSTSQSVKPSMMGRFLEWVDTLLSPASPPSQAQPASKSKQPVQQLSPKKLPTLRPSTHDKKLARLHRLRGGQSGGNSQSPLA